jgi:hypothetical protein
LSDYGCCYFLFDDGYVFVFAWQLFEMTVHPTNAAEVFVGANKFAPTWAA